MNRRRRSSARWLLPVACLMLLTSVGCVGGTTAASRQGVLAVGGTKAAVVPPLGLLWSKVQAPVFAKAPKDLGSRVGEASISQISLPPLPFPGLATGIPLFSWGNASTEDAADAGGIQDVKHADYEVMVVLMVYRRFTLKAYGD